MLSSWNLQHIYLLPCLSLFILAILLLVLLALSLQLSHHPAQTISDGLSEETPIGPLTNNRGKIRPDLQMFYWWSVSNLKFKDEKVTFLKAGFWRLNYRTWKIDGWPFPCIGVSPAAFSKGGHLLGVASHLLSSPAGHSIFFCCEMFFASDALRGSTLDSKGLGGLVCGGNNQLADEEFLCLKCLWMKVDQIPTF